MLNVRNALCYAVVGSMLLMAVPATGGDDSKKRSGHFDQLVSIQANSLAFSDVITQLSNQTTLEIIYRGLQPEARIDLNLQEAPLEVAIERVMRAYGISNHVMLTKPEHEPIKQLFIYGLSSLSASKIDAKQKRDEQVNGVVDALSAEQLFAISEQSNLIAAEMAEEIGPMSTEQMISVEESSAELVDKGYEGTQPLNPRQLEQVRSQSEYIKLNEPIDSPFSQEQIRRLRESGASIQRTEEFENGPLTPKQRALLRLQSSDTEGGR